ncbi:MAG: hypothetical protein K6347_07090 [Campylobacterales bacterium]
MTEIFGSLAPMVKFLHLMAAVLWVGGMIVVRLYLHPVAMRVALKERLAWQIPFLGRFFTGVSVAVFLLILTGVLMAVGMNIKETPLAPIVHLKYTIWLVMALIFGVILTRYRRAKAAWEAGEVEETARQLAPIAKVLIPINLILGVIAIFAGTTLRGF